MRKQTLIALLTAVSLSGVSVTALAEDGRDRDRNGGWKVEKQHDRDRDRQRERRKERRKEQRKEQRKAERRKERRTRDRDRIVIHKHDHDRDRHRHKRKYRVGDDLVIIKKKRPHRRYHRDRDVIIIDDGPVYRSWSNRNKRYARVVSVVPVRKVIRRGRHCRNDYDLGDWLELNLGDIIISAGKDRDCHYIDREVRKHYRVTYRYRGRLHTVRMHRHPGRFVRVNRFGELIRGRY